MERLKTRSGEILPNSRWGKNCFIWKIKDFFYHPQNSGHRIVSPNFDALGSEWLLEIFPIVYIRDIPHTQLQLRKMFAYSTPKSKVTYEFSIRGRRGSEPIMVCRGEKEFKITDSDVQKIEAPPLSQRTERNLWAPGGNVYVFLQLKESSAPFSSPRLEVEASQNHSFKIQPTALPFVPSSKIVEKAHYGDHSGELGASLFHRLRLDVALSDLRYCGMDNSDEQVASGLPFFLRNRQIEKKAHYRVRHPLDICSPPEVEKDKDSDDESLDFSGRHDDWQMEEEEEINSDDESLDSPDRGVGVQTDDCHENSEVSKVGQYKSCHRAVLGKDIGVQTDDFKEHSKNYEDGQCKSCHPKGTWQSKISQLYDTKDNTDVRFVVKERVFDAHRFVLYTRSPKFCRLLTGANAACDTHIIDAENVTETGFDILLRFLYKDTLETNDKRSIVEAYYCALYYQVQDLQDKCEEEMNAWKITQHEVWTLLDCGLDVSALRKVCADLLRREGAAAISSPDFQQISFKTLSFVLNNGVLKNVPALQRIERIMEWCIQPNPEETNYAGARNKLLGEGANPLLGRLEFENLELNDLSYLVGRYRGLITPDELVSFLKYNHTRDASVLPDWCLALSCE